METLSKQQLIEELDRMNQEAFKYVGVWHKRSGCRPEVESHREFIHNLNAKPIREIKILIPLTPIGRELKENAAVVIEFPLYVNIYNVDDVKDKLEELSKHKCMVVLEYGDE